MDIVIFANGVYENLKQDAADWLTDESLLVAADGGARYITQLGKLPAHIIGDLDSLGDALAQDLQQKGAELHRYPPAKDETDLELALLWAVEQHPSRIVVLGALGGRPDQELANYMLLTHPQLAGFEVVLAGGQWCIRLLRGGQTVLLKASLGDTVSLLPLSGEAAGIVTHGLAYPLDGESLYVGAARGVSNVVETLPVSISLKSGMLLVMQAKGGVS